MTINIPVITWVQSGYDTLDATYTCDVSVSSNYNFFLYGTDPAGGGNSEASVQASVVVIDNFNNGSTCFAVFGGSKFPIAPYARKTFKINKNQSVLSLNLSLGQVIVTFANYDIGVPDDVNQYAQTSGQVLSTTTLDPTRTVAGLVLSNSNLTGTGSGSVNGGNTQATVAKNAGKLYFELTATQIGTFQIMGLGPDGSNTAFSPSTGANGIGFQSNTGEVRVNNVSMGFPSGGWNNGDTFKCAINITNFLVWFAKVGGNWNANPSADPSQGIGGFVIPSGVTFRPIINIFDGGSANKFTVNFGGSPTLNPIPAGYTGWF